MSRGRCSGFGALDGFWVFASGEVAGHLYSGCDGGVEMLRYEVTGGGHVWPGAIRGRSEMGHTTSDFSAPRVIWEFLPPTRAEPRRRERAVSRLASGAL
jgi:hypothetical protein